MKTPFWQANNCYEILGAKPAASPQEIKSAYREASRRHHPDHGGSHEAMVRVVLAYEVLSNPVERVTHDLRWRIEAKSYSSSGGDVPHTKGASVRQPQAAPRTKTAPVSGLKRRVQERVEAETKATWADLQNRADHLANEFRHRMGVARRGAAYAFAAVVICGAVAVKLPLLWIAFALSALALFGKLSGPRVNGRTRSPLLFWGKELEEAASAEATNECSARASRLQRYQSALASIAELVLRPSTFDDSESQVARRITTAFFVLGYLPVAYSASDRTLLLSDGEEQVLVRFRHRPGAVVNISYVEKLVDAMRARRIKRGYLFCSPGLSGNAARFADEHNVRWYTIETMSQWIDDALMADYEGPDGDILQNIDTLESFLGKLSTALPARAGNPRPRRRRWRRW